jgi:hypothetical protein
MMRKMKKTRKTKKRGRLMDKRESGKDDKEVSRPRQQLINLLFLTRMCRMKTPAQPLNAFLPLSPASR